MTQLRALPVLVPPLPLQKEFAQRVVKIRAMEAEQSASRRHLTISFSPCFIVLFEVGCDGLVWRVQAGGL